MTSGKALIQWCSMLLLLSPLQSTAQTMLEGIRDGVVHMRADSTLEVDVKWTDAWQAEAHGERLTLQTGAGDAVEIIDIDREETAGQRRWTLPEQALGYRLEVAGYSFRHYQVRADNASAFVFEPAKLHFSLETRSSDLQLYFKVPAYAAVKLSGKNHQGVHTLRARRLSDDYIVHLPLTLYDSYPPFDQRTMPGAEQDEVWELTLVGSGKAAFWLDGAENLFSTSPEALITPSYPTLEIDWAVGTEPVGPLPKLGAALPYSPVPAGGASIVERLGLQAGGFYTFTDVLPAGAEKEAGFRGAYVHQFGVDDSITLVAATGRKAVMEDDSETGDAIESWINTVLPRLSSGRHYIAVADEPNLNYADYDSFERYFGNVVTRAKDQAKAQGNELLVAAPASSRFVDGPTTSNSITRRGSLWAERLLARHGNLIDAVAWHEWQIRDLRSTGRYRDHVRHAAEVVGLDQQGRPNKALLLTQTNPSSGNALSVYEQNTHYAALWLAGAAINASADGLLDMFLWFKAVDDPDFPKGLLTTDLAFKPAGNAMAFLTSAWRGEVISSSAGHLELDALVVKDNAQYRMLGVNKGRHPVKLRLATAFGDCESGQTARLLSAAGETTAESRCEDGLHLMDLPPETLFILPLKTRGSKSPRPPGDFSAAATKR